MIMHHLFRSSYAIGEIRKLLEVLNALGGNLSISELYEEDGGMLCQIHGKMVELEVLFHLYSDIDGNRFVWCTKKHMPFIPEKTRPCRVCGKDGSYVLVVDGGRYEHVCSGCIRELARIWLFLKGRPLEWESYTWKTIYPYGKSNPDNFVGYVLFYVERLYPIATSHRDNLRLMLTNTRTLPTSVLTRDFLEWARKNRDRHYPSWFTSMFVERRKIPVVESTIGMKIMEAALDYTNERGIEPKPPVIDDTVDLRNGRKWCTKEVVPVDLYTTNTEKGIYFVGLVDSVPALFYTRTRRKRFDHRSIIWGSPVKMRFRIERVPAVWNGYRIVMRGTNLTEG